MHLNTTFCILLLLPMLCLASKTVVVVGGDFAFAPYEYLDKDGKPVGYNVDITRAIADVMGFEVEIQLGNWDTMRRKLSTGEIDVLQGMTSTPSRQDDFTFAPPSAIIQQSIFARRDYAEVDDLSSLSGKSVIVQNRGSVHDYLLLNNFDINIIPVKTHVDALRMLSSGQHDYAIVANLPGLYWGKELGLSNLKVVGRPFASKGYGYAVKKGDEQTLALFSEGLAILKNTGKQQEIYDKWLGQLEEPSRFNWQKLGLLAMLLSLITLMAMGVVVMWNRALKSQVDKRTKELRVQQKQLIQADKMASLGVLVSGIGHEINNPTGLLLLNLPVISDAWSDSQEILEAHYQANGDFMMAGLRYSRMRDEIPYMIDEMQEGARRIKRIVNDLKDFARQEEDLEETLVNLNEVLATAVRLVDSSIRKSTDHFTLHYQSYLPLVKGSAQRIEQVIINLIVNACQSLQSRDQAVSLKTYYDDVKSMVALQVTDQGVGIDQADIPRLTDPFFTTKRQQGGTGLGLSVSAGIVQAHNGLLKFSSVKGRGTTVTMSLPAARRMANV